MKEIKKEYTEKLTEVILSHFNISFNDLVKTTRRRDNVLPRQLFCYVAHKNKDLSLKEICEHLKLKNTQIVSFSEQQIKKRYPELKNVINEIECLLY